MYPRNAQKLFLGDPTTFPQRLSYADEYVAAVRPAQRRQGMHMLLGALVTMRRKNAQGLVTESYDYLIPLTLAVRQTSRYMPHQGERERSRRLRKDIDTLPFRNQFGH